MEYIVWFIKGYLKVVYLNKMDIVIVKRIVVFVGMKNILVFFDDILRVIICF